ncbi:MAG: carboxypeptidase-like regulatory domain-containing protein [Bacteroidota bacterium]
MLKITRLLAVVFMLCFSQHLFAQQSATIKGIVTDDLNNFVESAKITLKGTSFSATSGQDGSFEIKDVPNGDYEIEISAIDHTNYSKNIGLNGKTLDLGFVVMESTSGLNDDNRDNIPVASISDSEIRESSAQTVSGVLSASRDAFVSATTNTFSSARFRIRVYDNENFITYMNGVQMTDMLNGN